MEKITKVQVETIIAKGFDGLTAEDYEILVERAKKSFKTVDYSKTKKGKESAEKRESIVAVLMEMGEATADEIAEKAGVSKASVAPALKALIDGGQAEKFSTTESYKDENGKRKTRSTMHYRVIE